MDQDRRQPALDELGNRLRQAGRGSRREPDDGPDGAPQSGLSQEIRVAAEMVAALLLGGVAGWWLDSWLGTRPWLLIAFLFLGIASGTLNAFRAARRLGAGRGSDSG